MDKLPIRMGDRGRAIEGEVAPVSVSAVRRGEAPSRDLVEVFWRGRWILLIAIVTSLVAAILYLRNVTPLYEASSRLFIEQSGPKIIQDSVGGVMSGGSNYLATQCELMRSGAILNLAAESPRLKGLRMFRAIDNPAGAVRSGLEVTIGKNNDIVTVSFLSAFPEEAAVVVNTVVDAYTTYHSNQKRSTAGEVLKILQKEKSSHEIELNEKLQAMLEYRRLNSDVSFEADHSSGAGSIVGQRVSSLTDALTQSQIETIDAKAKLELIRGIVKDPDRLRQAMTMQSQANSPGGAAMAPMTNPQETQNRASLFQAEAALDDLINGHKLLPSHPQVLAAQQRVAYLRSKLEEGQSLPLTPGVPPPVEMSPDQRFAQAILVTAEERYRVASAKEKELQDSFGKSIQAQQAAAVAANNKVATYALMESAFKRLEKLCDMLDDRMKEVRVTEDTGALNVSILEVARPAVKPSKPDRARTLSIALMFGIILGTGLSMMNAWMDQRLRSADEIMASLSLPLLGAVPNIAGDTLPSNRGRRVHLEPSSDIAEAYRTVRTSLYFGVTDSKTKTLLVTSPQPGDGKSTSASNLSIALAQAGQRTLILDSDFRKPTQHKIFSVGADVGMSSVLAGTKSLDEVIQPTGIKNLDILPCGPIPKNPAEILNSQAFADILNVLAERYDHVVLDSPPVMPVTDARIIGAIADVTILVLRADKSTRKAGEYARDVLLSVGTNILGVVVNGIRRGRGRYGYYYGYYQYGYGERKGGDAQQKQELASST